MKFDCKEISISDEELGCILTFSEKDDGIAQMNMTTEELMNSSGQYLMLQRTYSEDKFEKDYYYLETSDFEKNSGELNDFTIDLFRSQFIMIRDNETFQINIKVDDQKFENLKRIIKKIINKKGQLNFHD
jgi:hypothetical protein